MSALLLSPRAGLKCGLAGLALLVLCGIYGFFDPRRFFEGYLTAYVFWTQIALGSLGLLFIQYLTGGRWGMTVTRLLEAGAMTLPLCAVLFLPLFAGMPWLFRGCIRRARGCSISSRRRRFISTCRSSSCGSWFILACWLRLHCGSGG